ncbi:MAG: Orotidine-5-phosphate decarboxylase [Bacteroidota bacterium]|jgi:orotidine-5'-phosphate decarboxylase
MTLNELIQQIFRKKSYLCVGLDSDPALIPSSFKKEIDPIFAFNKAVIDATADVAVAYKPNIAFYEALGPKGWESLQKTIEYIPKEIFTIADAKRGDIGNTATKYAQTFYDPSYCGLDFDSVTVAPYMGKDSVEPFLQFEQKWVILLALTSNPGSLDFQLMKDENGKTFYQNVLTKSQEWGTVDNLMYVVGATRAEFLQDVRKFVPDHFLLVPGIGAQGGSLEEVSKFGMNKNVGLLVNSSRGIIYAGDDTFTSSRREALKVQKEMEMYLEKYYK